MTPNDGEEQKLASKLLPKTSIIITTVNRLYTPLAVRLYTTLAVAPYTALAVGPRHVAFRSLCLARLYFCWRSF